MDQFKPFVKAFSNGRLATAVRVPPGAAPAAVAQALALPLATRVLLLSGGAAGMLQPTLDRLSAPFAAVGQVLAQEGVTVIDGGTQSGVMALMGEALARNQHTAPYVGVLPVYAEVGTQGARGDDVLEPHHTHFVLIESDRWGDESKFMCDLASHLSAQAPSLALLASGGEAALQDIEWNVRRGREIVVLAGSGRLADDVADWVRRQAGLTGERRSALNEAVLSGQGPMRERVAAVARAGRITLFELSEPPAELARLVRSRLTG